MLEIPQTQRASLTACGPVISAGARGPRDPGAPCSTDGASSYVPLSESHVLHASYDRALRALRSAKASTWPLTPMATEDGATFCTACNSTL